MLKLTLFLLLVYFHQTDQVGGKAAFSIFNTRWHYFSLIVNEIVLLKLFLLKFWMRQLLPTDFISTCNTFATFEKCMACSSKAGLVPGDLGTLILLAVTSNYHKHLGDHNFPQRICLHLCTFRVLKYASCFACKCILPSAERSSDCIMIPRKQLYPELCLGTWYSHICMVAMCLFTISSK